MTTRPPPQPMPCPWCGTVPEVRLYGDFMEVLCLNDGCPVKPDSTTYNSELEAIQAWNIRQPVVPVARLRELAEELMSHISVTNPRDEWDRWYRKGTIRCVDQLAALLPVEDNEKGGDA